MNPEFPDWFRPASVVLDGETLRKRWTTIEELTTSCELSDVVDLLRLCFAPSSASAYRQSFCEAFQESDPAFPCQGNELEVAILCASALNEVVGQDSNVGDAAALAVVAASCCERRSVECSDRLYISAWRHIRHRSAARWSGATIPDMTAATLKSGPQLKAIKNFTADTAIQELVQGPLADQLQAILGVLEKLRIDIKDRTAALESRLALVAEEQQVLWWMAGRYLHSCDVRASELPLVGACIVAGYELAGLVKEMPGPARVIPYIEQALGHTDEWPPAVPLDDAIAACPQEWRKRFEGCSGANHRLVAPLSYALGLSIASQGNTWLEVWSGHTGLPPSLSLTGQQFATQVYAETLACRELGIACG